MYTVDASVWISASFPGEREQSVSRAFVDRLSATRPQVFLPHLAYVEVAATISRVHGDPTLGIALADAIDQLRFVRWVVLDLPLARSSAMLAATSRLRGADAVYAAVAAQQGCYLVSLDNEHLTRLTGVVTTLTPAQATSRL